MPPRLKIPFVISSVRMECETELNGRFCLFEANAAYEMGERLLNFSGWSNRSVYITEKKKKSVDNYL